MVKRQIFYSFHYANDVMRVQQIRNRGMLVVLSLAKQGEKIRHSGDERNRKMDRMTYYAEYRSCVVPLIRTETTSDRGIQYEDKKKRR